MQASDLSGRRPGKARGVTLIELVVVIALTAIVAAMVGVFIVRPVEGYTALSRRAELVDSAESALRRMARDIRLAVPNSVRRTDLAPGFALEMLPTLDGARYATGEASTCENLTGFDPAAADDHFDMLGTFSTITPCSPCAGYRVVINNQGEGTGHDVYADGATSPSPAVITPATTTVAIRLNSVAADGCPANNKHHVTLAPAHQFRASSPRDRAYVVTTPVSYVCEPGAGTLVRYENYAIQATQPTTAGAFGVAGAVVAANLESCSVTTTTTEIRDRGLVTLTLTLHDQGERIRLVHQVQLDNSR
jgi:MSHA biogenesis protein MshO